MASVYLQRQTEDSNEMNERLMKMQKVLRQLIEKSPTAVALADKRGKIIYVNAKLEALFGYSRKELLLSPIEILFPERYREKHPALRSGFDATRRRVR